MEKITLQNFIKISVENINIKIGSIVSSIFHTTTYEVVLNIKNDVELTYSVNKRYTEFQGLYDSLTFRYHNLTFPKFPSKNQVFYKEETRKKFFDSLLMDILMLSSVHKEIHKELLAILYEFIFGNGIKESNVKKKDDDSTPLDSRKNNSFDLSSPNKNDKGIILYEFFYNT